MTTSPAPNAVPKFASLDEIVSHLHHMTADPLASEGTNIVVCRGNPTSKLMLIGEAPGPQEDKQGKPFVGPSGKQLEKIFASVGLETERDVFTTNSVYRMPKGAAGSKVRKPTPDEIDYYRPYLLEIIRLVDPKIMLLTGGVSMRAILNETKLGITKMRGQWHEIGGRWIMPIFHPAYLLRNPSKQPGSPKSLMWQDIQEVKRKYDELGLGGNDLPQGGIAGKNCR